MFETCEGILFLAKSCFRRNCFAMASFPAGFDHSLSHGGSWEYAALLCVPNGPQGRKSSSVPLGKLSYKVKEPYREAKLKESG